MNLVTKPFRLYKANISYKNLKFNDICLIDQKQRGPDNCISLLVGNNGTGKSSFLGAIAQGIKRMYKTNSYDLFENLHISKLPSKLIAISNSLFDKFPFDSFYHKSATEELFYNKQKYVYLGTRGRFGANNTNLMKRSVDILLENYSKKNVSRAYRYVFKYLNYKPRIILQYQIVRSDLIKSRNENINLDSISSYIDKKSNYSKIDQKIYQEFTHNYRDRFVDIKRFLNNFYNSEEKVFTIEIDLEDYQKSTHSYEKNLENYEILKLLSKLKLINRFSLILFDENYNPINFGDSSSGESSILTTLLALIPLLENDSCVLIDEPEVSLHPKWQYRYIELINNILAPYSGCHVIIATHSHFLVSDLPNENTSIVTLNKSNNQITSEFFKQSTFGSSAEDILLNVFKMPSTRNFYLSQILGEALELLSDGRYESHRFQEIQNDLSEIKFLLKSRDPLKKVVDSILSVK